MAVDSLITNIDSLDKIGVINNTSTIANSNSSFNLNSIGSLENNVAMTSSTSRPENLLAAAMEENITRQFKYQLMLLRLQEKIQNEALTVQLISNIMKARHDAIMECIRNIK